MNINEADREYVIKYVKIVLDEARLVHRRDYIEGTLAELNVLYEPATTTRSAGYVVLDTAGEPLDVFIREAELGTGYSMESLRQHAKDNRKEVRSLHTDLIDMLRDGADDGADVEFTHTPAPPASSRYGDGEEEHEELSSWDEVVALYKTGEHFPTPAEADAQFEEEVLARTRRRPGRGTEAVPVSNDPPAQAPRPVVTTPYSRAVRVVRPWDEEDEYGDDGPQLG